LNKADEVISLTEYLVNNLRTFGLKRTDIRIIPWGIDTDLFIFKEREKEIPVEFLHIANLHPVKDPETLLRAFKIISDKIESRLTIIGEGILEQYVRNLAKELHLGSKITFLGLMPYDALPAFYNRADILLHTSLSEGQCEVVTEAMSCGLLVCGTRVGLIYDRPSCCVGVPVKDFKKLADEVTKILDDQQRMKIIVQNAYSWASTHSIHWTVDSVKQLYFRLTDASR
jgi:glycosyltransferase involved in cell wall biosynthesis